MKKVIKDLIQISKLSNIIHFDVAIKLEARNEKEFNDMLELIDRELKDQPFRWSRLENFADIDKTKKITFTY